AIQRIDECLTRRLIRVIWIGCAHIHAGIKRPHRRTPHGVPAARGRGRVGRPPAARRRSCGAWGGRAYSRAAAPTRRGPRRGSYAVALAVIRSLILAPGE